MDSYEFIWFRQVIDEMLPALAAEMGVMLDTKFDIDERSCWHIPVGDVKVLDTRLTDRPEYQSLKASEYM